MTRREKRANAQFQSKQEKSFVRLDPDDFSCPREFKAFDPVLPLMPKYADIPEDFRRDRTPWNQIQSKWFFEGLDLRILHAKPGINKRQALNHLVMIQHSFEPKHEHKSAAVAYLMSLWFNAPDESSG